MLKKCLWIVVIALVLVIGILAVVIAKFDPNKFKQTLNEQVQAHTGRTLTITGDIHLSYFPALGIQVQGVRLSNPAGFPSGDFIDVGHVDVALATWPLLLGHWNITAFTLNDATINLMKNRQGNGNWLLGAKDPTIAKQSEKKVETSASVSNNDHAAYDLNLNASEISIKNAVVNWQDFQNNTDAQLQQVNFESAGVQANKALPFSLNANFRVGQPLQQGKVSLKGTLALMRDNTAAAKQLQVQLTQANFNLSGQNLPNGQVSGRLQGLIEYGLQDQALQLKNINLSGEPLQLNNASFQIESPAPQQQLVRFTAGLLVYGKTVLNDVLARVQLQPNQATLSALQASLYQGKINAEGELKGIGAQRQLALKFNVSGVHAQALLQPYNIPVGGQINLSSVLLAQGATTDALLANLRGKAKLDVKDGKLIGINVIKAFAAARRFLHQPVPSDIPAGDDTPFSHFGADFVIDQGIARTDNLLLASDWLEVSGLGDINLAKQTLNLRLLAGIKRSGQKTISGDQALPLLVSGTFSNPSIGPDMGTLIAQQAKYELNKEGGQLDKALDKIGPAGQRLKGVLQQLF